jgi:hypothetical protein
MNGTPIGPHEGRELDLMQAGLKPLSMFVDTDPAEFFPEIEFDRLVLAGMLVKRVHDGPNQNAVKHRRILYALAGQEWRIDAMLLVLSIHSSGWHPDIERVVGTLLGYERADIEAFISQVPPDTRPPRPPNRS